MAKLIFSLRLHLAGMVIVTLLPALAILLYDGNRYREGEIRHGRELALAEASRLAVRQELVTTRIRQIMDLLALLPEVREGEVAFCNRSSNPSTVIILNLLEFMRPVRTGRSLLVRRPIRKG
jgi:hypothetical protein